MNDQDKIRQKIEEELASAVNRIVERSRAADREEVDRLLRARSISFGFGVLVLGAGSLRSLWVRTLRRFGHNAKVARGAEPAAYAWLYRNDRAWLSTQNRSQQRERLNSSSIDWGQRDAALSAAVLRAAVQISNAGKGPIRLLDLLATVPSLKQKIEKLEKLPLTERALGRVLQRRSRAQGSLFK